MRRASRRRPCATPPHPGATCPCRATRPRSETRACRRSCRPGWRAARPSLSTPARCRCTARADGAGSAVRRRRRSERTDCCGRLTAHSSRKRTLFSITGKGGHSSLGWAVSPPERRAASDESLCLPVVVALGKLVGEVASLRVVGSTLGLRVGVESVGAARFRVYRSEVPFAEIADVVAESRGLVDPGAFRQRRRELLRVSHRVVVGDAGFVRPAPREQRAPRRRTQWAGGKGVAEDRSRRRQPVDIRGRDVRPAKAESRRPATGPSE